MISELKLKLAQTEENVTCPAIHRLRAKLRDLMKGEPIETLVSISKSCEDLRSENENLKAEMANLKRALAQCEAKIKDIEEPKEVKVVETVTVPEYVDIEDLLNKLNNCEQTVANLTKELEEKNNKIDALNKELEQMLILKSLEEQIMIMKQDLKKKDEKVRCSKVMLANLMGMSFPFADSN